jgi:hypothetical protein
MRRALVGSDRLGSGCLVLRTDTRENPGGKNGVMTTLSQIAIGWSDPVWKFIQTIGDKLGFDTCQIAIG